MTTWCSVTCSDWLSCKVDLVHKELFTNGSLTKGRFSILTGRRRIGTDDLNLRFFISTKYDYKNKRWNSGVFNIDETYWDNSKNDGLTFSIEEDRFMWTFREQQWTSLNDTQNTIGLTIPNIELYQSKIIKTQNRPGYHFCKNESTIHLTFVSNVSITAKLLCLLFLFTLTLVSISYQSHNMRIISI